MCLESRVRGQEITLLIVLLLLGSFLKSFCSVGMELM